MRCKKFAAALTAGIMLMLAMTSTTFAYSGETDTTGTAEASENENEQLGTVRVSPGSHLHLRSGAGMSYEIIGKLVNGERVRVVGGDGTWYKVVVPERTGYVHGNYLNVSQQSTSANEPAEQPDNNTSAPQQSQPEDSGSGLTPPGNLTLVDDIGATSTAGQQFITLVSKNGNTFYLVIDRDTDGNENVHFMNLVDEADLFALLDEDAQAAYQGQLQPPAETPPAPTERPEESTPEPEAEPEKQSNWAPMMLLAIVGIGGIGFAGYRVINKKKQAEAAAKPDPDADYQDEEDEEYDIPEEDDYEEDEIDSMDMVEDDTEAFDSDKAE